MAITDAKKVDYLWKKLGYGATKTDTNAAKKGPNEAIASPLLLRGDKVWNQANGIPATMPGSNTDVVTVYLTTAPDECAEDTTATTSRSWKTGLTDWIPPEFGSTYGVKVYIHTAGQMRVLPRQVELEFMRPVQVTMMNFSLIINLVYYTLLVLTYLMELPFQENHVYVSGARYTGTIGGYKFNSRDR